VQIEFRPRGDGWRGRGRPPAEVPAEVMDALRATYEQGLQAQFPVYGASEAEVRAFVQLLRHGADQMGKRLKQQVHAGVLRFYVEDRT
jgi:hypothetical protein